MEPRRSAAEVSGRNGSGPVRDELRILAQMQTDATGARAHFQAGQRA
jgi:hypothetical protein